MSTRLAEGVYPGARALGMAPVGQAVWVQVQGLPGTIRAIAATEINRLTHLTVTVDAAGVARVFNERPQRTILQRQGRFLQTRPLPIEEELTYGVVYAVATGRGILVGGDRPQPAVIEGQAGATVLQVQKLGDSAIAWSSINPGLLPPDASRWLEGETQTYARFLDATLGGGFTQLKQRDRTDSDGVSTYSGSYFLVGPDGSETLGVLSGTDASLANGPTNFMAQVPLLPGITRPCSVYQIDSPSAITGNYDAQQPLMLRSDGLQAIALHRYGSIASGARSQESRVFLLDSSGIETPVNSSPGILLSTPLTPVELGVLELEVNSDFNNYLDDSPRPIFSVLNGTSIVLTSRIDGAITKGLGTITSHTTTSVPGSFGGVTILQTVSVAITQVLSVPFDGALSIVGAGDATVLYSNTGSVVDFLLQSQAYRYTEAESNLTGLGESGDLSGKVPLTNFNLIGNSLIDGPTYAQWQGDRIYVSENRSANLAEPATVYADEWRLVPGLGGMQFIKQEEPVEGERSAVTEPDEIYSLLSSAFYQA